MVIFRMLIDLSKFNIKELAKRIGALSEDVKMFMYLPNAKRYCALNDRTIKLLMKDNIGMSATTVEYDDHGGGGGNYVSVAEVVATVYKET